MKQTVKPRRVDFLQHRDDLQSLVLGQLGFSTEYISQMTGLSHCQVLYRLQKGNTRRMDYRNGNSGAAGVALSLAELKIANRIRNELKATK